MFNISQHKVKLISKLTLYAIFLLVIRDWDKRNFLPPARCLQCHDRRRWSLFRSPRDKPPSHWRLHISALSPLQSWLLLLCELWQPQGAPVLQWRPVQSHCLPKPALTEIMKSTWIPLQRLCESCLKFGNISLTQFWKVNLLLVFWLFVELISKLLWNKGHGKLNSQQNGQLFLMSQHTLSVWWLWAHTLFKNQDWVKPCSKWFTFVTHLIRKEFMHYAL